MFGQIVLHSLPKKKKKTFNLSLPFEDFVPIDTRASLEIVVFPIDAMAAAV
jgi:hypothetical protein